MKKKLFEFLCLCLICIVSTNTISVSTSRMVINHKTLVYKFYDVSVQKAAEQYLNKSMDKFTKSDIKKLANCSYLVIHNTVKSLKDIPVLFPNIRFIKINYDGQIPTEDIGILSRLKDLKALTLYTTLFPSLNFVKKLDYVEISYSKDGYLSHQNNLVDFSLMAKDNISPNMKGHITKYLRITDNNKIYELFVSDYIENANNVDRFGDKIERKLFVSDISNGKVHLNSILDASTEMGDCPSNRLYFSDVNFNGQKDLLVDNGHFGTQGLVNYTCFLYNKDKYKPCGSFSGIANPSVDSVHKKILSTWRNWAASHSWAMYSYINGKYIMTDILTEEEDNKAEQNDKDHKEIWDYTVEKLIKGSMQKIAFYSTKNTTHKKINNLFFNKNSFWGLESDKWDTIYNLGSLVHGFSIYDGDDVNQTIIDIINKS